jgi:cytochrome c
MKKTACMMALLILFTFSQVQADDNKATPKDVYDIVLKAYEVVKALGDEALPAFNDPKGEFLYKDTYVYVMRCPSEMAAHPYAMKALKGVDLDKAYSFTALMCNAGEQPSGGWVEYEWPKPGEKVPSRKVGFSIKVEGTPYTVSAGIYNDTDKVQELNKTLR